MCAVTLRLRMYQCTFKIRKLNKDKLTFEDVARKLLVRFDEILLRNCREEPARRFERIIWGMRGSYLLRKFRWGNCEETARSFEEVPRKIHWFNKDRTRRKFQQGQTLRNITKENSSLFEDFPRIFQGTAQGIYKGIIRPVLAYVSASFPAKFSAEFMEFSKEDLKEF